MEERVEVSKIVAELDREIARLKEARALLVGEPAPRRGAQKKATAAKRTGRMSAEGRRRIAEAMKKRWAERRKQAGKAK
jgi:hypothetical protein